MPEPKTGEDKSAFIARCMASEEHRSSFPDEKQRAAVCYSKWERRNNSADCECRGGSNPCECSPGHRIRAQVAQGMWRKDTLDGREMLVAPVVMAKANVIMNNALLRSEEFVPEAWNGIPVTVGHPKTSDGFISANASPATHEEWVIGKVFHARIEGSDLKSEAWIDVEKAESVMPGLIAHLQDPDTQMNVSTGYYSKDFDEPGTIGGRPYGIVSRNIRPNHLALLPNESGACSWQDGCGVRTNEEKSGMKLKANEAVLAALKTLGSALGITANEALEAYVAEDEASRKKLFANIQRLLANERGEDDDRRQMVADLISNDDSPFLPDDEDSLRMMSEATLKTIRDKYIPPAKKDGEREPAPANNAAQTDPPAQRKDNMSQKPIATITSSQLQAFIANEVKRGVDAVLTEDQRASLKLLDNQAQQHRQGLVERIVANTTMTADQLKAFSLQQLEVMSNGIVVQPDYSGQRLAHNAQALDEKDAKDAAPLSSFAVNERIAKAVSRAH